jgi:CybS, succinate dehydrogenase cytochrome B small subunit
MYSVIVTVTVNSNPFQLRSKKSKIYFLPRTLRHSFDNIQPTPVLLCSNCKVNCSCKSFAKKRSIYAFMVVNGGIGTQLTINGGGNRGRARLLFLLFDSRFVPFTSIMISLLRTTQRLVVPTHSQRLVAPRRQTMSTTLEGDVGKVGTKVHHMLNTGLAVATPLYFLTPDSYTDGFLSKTFGVALSASIAAHSWIGLNYVCRDYVPKISSKLLGPARIATAGLAAITLLGMAKISVSSPGGLKGLVKGLWTAPKKKSDEKDF